MSNIIKANGQPILVCSNPLLNMLYDSLLLIADQSEYKNNCKVIELIQALDQENTGLGCVSIDLANYRFDKDEISAVTSLFTSAIEYTNAKSLIDEIATMTLKNFAKKLIKSNEILTTETKV